MMGQISAKLRSVDGGNFAHWCPGCEEMHVFYVGTPTRKGARWAFDGNANAPTFAPSMNISADWSPEDGGVERCHYFLQSGRIQFLSDSTHALAGKIVDLPDLPPCHRDARS